MLDERKKINSELALCRFRRLTMRARVLVAARAGTYNSAHINRSSRDTAAELISGEPHQTFCRSFEE
jgi:hypothetical protein